MLVLKLQQEASSATCCGLLPTWALPHRPVVRLFCTLVFFQVLLQQYFASDVMQLRYMDEFSP